MTQANIPIKHNEWRTTALPVTLRWHQRYWLWAALPMLLVFAFEALQISLLETSQAPNVSAMAQILLMLVFFLAWIVVPRVIWQQFHPLPPTNGWLPLLLKLGLIGIGLSALHLLLLAGLLRLMYSAPGWGISQLLQSWLEVWLGYAGLWLLLYCLTCLCIGMLQWRQQSVKPMARIAVRHAGNTYYLQPEDIIWIEADGNYARIYHQHQVYMLRQSLSALQRSLPGTRFMRTHRQALVNLNQVRSLMPAAGTQTYRLALNGDLHAPVSRRYLALLKQRLGQGAPTTH